MKALFTISILTALVGCTSTKAPLPTLPTQTAVDLQKYAGTWYEQARLPNRFQKECADDVQADYILNPNNTIRVINRCKAADGSIKMVEGEGRLSASFKPSGTAKLEVRFAPKWTSWLPLVWGDYWILKLVGDYQYSLVGTPDRQYLWVLSRSKKADQKTVQQLVDYAGTLDFPVEKMIKNK